MKLREWSRERKKKDNIRKFKKSGNCEFAFEPPFFEEPCALKAFVSLTILINLPPIFNPGPTSIL